MTAGPVAPTAGLAAGRFGALAFAYFAAIGLFNPYAPLWFQSLGFSTVVIGAIASLQSWTRVLSPYAWSWSGDHSGRRVELIRLAAAGALLSALGLLGFRAALPVALVTETSNGCAKDAGDLTLTITRKRGAAMRFFSATSTCPPRFRPVITTLESVFPEMSTLATAPAD